MDTICIHLIKPYRKYRFDETNTALKENLPDGRCSNVCVQSIRSDKLETPLMSPIFRRRVPGVCLYNLASIFGQTHNFISQEMGDKIVSRTSVTESLPGLRQRAQEDYYRWIGQRERRWRALLCLVDLFYFWWVLVACSQKRTACCWEQLASREQLASGACRFIC